MPTLDEVRARRSAAPKKDHPSNDFDDEVDPNLVVEPQAQADPNRTEDDPVARTALALQDDTANIVWYGDGGTGKTTDIASAANLGRIILINAETGVKRRALERRGINTANIDIIPDPESGDEITYDLLDKLFWELKADLESGNSEYIAVGWDSLTEIAKKALTNTIARRVEKANRPGGKGSTDPFFTDISDYGYMTEQMRLLVRHYRDLPCHFLATCLERRDTDDDGRVIYRPQLTPALAADVYGYVDCVIRTELVEVEGEDVFRGLTRPAGKYRAKDRFGALPKYLIDPTFERALGYIEEEIKVESDDVQQKVMTAVATKTVTAAEADD